MRALAQWGFGGPGPDRFAGLGLPLGYPGVKAKQIAEIGNHLLFQGEILV